MPIKINISLTSGGRSKPVASRTLNDKLITIGRDDECTLTLEDTQKHVSRVHAELEEEDGIYVMKVVSKVNPVIVNGKRYMFGDRVALSDGDAMSIGLYKLEIVEPEIPAKAEPVPAQAEPVPAQAEEITDIPAARDPSKSESSPLSKAAPPESAADLEEATYIPSPKPAPVAKEVVAQEILPPEEEEATFIPPASARPESVTKPAAQRLPQETIAQPVESSELDFDLSGEADESEEQTYVKPPPETGAAPKIPPIPAAVQDETEFSDEMTMIRRPAAAPPAPAAPPPTAAPRTIAPALQDEGEFSDEATMIRRPAAAPPAPAAPPPTAAPRTIAPALQDETEFSDEATMIRRPAVSPPVAAAQPARSAGAHAANAEVQAFLEGAGLTALDIPDAQAFMRSSGMMIRAAIEGFMTLLLAREEARKEIGAATADPEATGNPLKLIADPLEFAAFLFDPKRPIIGDVDPVQAFGDACSDLRSHQAALLESIRAAAIAALDRVDPKKIEREHGTNLGGLNLTRKSKLWDLAIAQHEKFSREVESNLNSAVGQEVLAAYMARVSKHRGR